MHWGAQAIVTLSVFVVADSLLLQGAQDQPKRQTGETNYGLEELPSFEQCKSFLTVAKPDGLQSEKNMKGFEGGQWSPCTHLKQYGLNFVPFVGRFLAYQLAPKTAFEFGCGLGTMSDFVARFAGARVTCVEPENTLGELIMSLRSDMRGNGELQQLAVNIFSEESKVQSCVKSGALKSDLVYSFEVAEHIPAQFHSMLVSTLANATNKWLVFSAARPEQGGTGHIPESMVPREQWIQRFEAAGLIFMPQLTRLARQTAYPLRSYDLYTNMLVFRAPSHYAEDTDVPHEKLARLNLYWGEAGMNRDRLNRSESGVRLRNAFREDFERWGSSNDGSRVKHLEAYAKGLEGAIWPELVDKEIAVKSGDMCGQAGHRLRLPSSPRGQHVEEDPRHEVAFESAWAAHFHYSR